MGPNEGMYPAKIFAAGKLQLQGGRRPRHARTCTISIYPELPRQIGFASLPSGKAVGKDADAQTSQWQIIVRHPARAGFGVHPSDCRHKRSPATS